MTAKAGRDAADGLAPAQAQASLSRPAAPGHVWVDGRIVAATTPVLTAFDRGFQLGDGIFETLRARGGHPTELTEHIARLRRSAEGLAIQLPDHVDRRLATAIDDLLAVERLAGPDGDASVRITVSRGSYFGRGLLPPDEHPAPTIVVQAWPVTPIPASHLEQGLHLAPSSVRRDPDNPLNGLKTTSRADYVYARVEARAHGADDALFLTIDGYLSESTSANLFLVQSGTGGGPGGGPGGAPGGAHDPAAELATPALACAILPGTTRDWILRWGAEVGLRPVEGLLTTRDLHEADEAFLSSSVAGILPVTRFAGEPIGSGRPGPWTLRARADRETFIREGG